MLVGMMCSINWMYLSAASLIHNITIIALIVIWRGFDKSEFNSLSFFLFYMPWFSSGFEKANKQSYLENITINNLNKERSEILNHSPDSILIIEEK